MTDDLIEKIARAIRGRLEAASGTHVVVPIEPTEAMKGIDVAVSEADMITRHHSWRSPRLR